MATYDSLTQDQKDILSAWERNTRGWCNTYSTLLLQARQLIAAANASNGPRDIVTSLDNGEVVPNTSGVAGAHDLTKQEMAGMLAFLDEGIANSDNDPDLELLAKIAGPTAGL